MDPGLQELIAEGGPRDETAVVVRLRRSAAPPAGLRIVARFGQVATARAARSDLVRLHADPAIISLKAPRIYTTELDAIHDVPGLDEADPDPQPLDVRRPPGLAETGRGVVVAVIDWGCDYALPDFRKPDGSTRLLALWDQRAAGDPAPYGYGRIHDRAAIDRALKASDPFAALNYQTSDKAQHGTHVLGIAAGGGRSGGPAGVAPEADIVFCHMGSSGEDLGNSIELLEAIDFAVKASGERPLVINLSIGRHAGPHDGSLLVERAIDWLITNRPGTAVVQSTGNYYSRRVHMSGRLHETKRMRLPIEVRQRGKAPVSVEVWYPRPDEFTVELKGPDGAKAAARRGGKAPVTLADGREVGVLYHRAFDPNNGDHLINLVLHPAAPVGNWVLQVTGVDVVDGRWHAWIERDAACPKCQAQFARTAAHADTTTGSICNAMRTIAVGAYDRHDGAHPPADFSSIGPTRDGRTKPLLAAPGVRVLSCRSRPDAGKPAGYVRMSGTSMASPHVAGTVALMLEAAGRQPIAALRRTLFANLDAPGEEGPRYGYGLLDIEAAVVAARKLRGGATPTPARPPQPPARKGRKPREGAEAPESWPQPAAPVVDLLDPMSFLPRAMDVNDLDFEPIGLPGQPLSSRPRVGDIPLSLSGGEPVLIAEDEAAEGALVQVADLDGARGAAARRIAGPDGLVLAEHVLIRPLPEMATEPPSHAATVGEVARRTTADPPVDPPASRPPPVAFKGAVIPVIVLPGVMGTRLTFPPAVKLPNWDPDSLRAMGGWFLAGAAAKMNGLSDASPARILADSKDRQRHARGWDQVAASIYDPLISAIEHAFAPTPLGKLVGLPQVRCPVWVFGYDWRLSNAAHAGRLEAFVSSVLETERAEQVIFVTHSMGGLVARAALAMQPQLGARVKGVIHTVFPACGAVVAARRFRTGFAKDIDGSLGEAILELVQDEVAAEMGLETDDGEGGIKKSLATYLQQAIFSDSRRAASPAFYNRLMSVVAGPMELLPTDAAPRAWWPPMAREPMGTSVFDVYPRPSDKGGLVHPSVSPTADGARLVRRFAEAHAFHDRIAGRYHPVTGLVLSTGLTTDTTLDPQARPKEGDGTVPAFSGRCPDLQAPHFVATIKGAEHAGCFTDKAFLDAVLDGLDLIARGGPATGTRPPPKRLKTAGAITI